MRNLGNIFAMLICATAVQADLFGTGTNQFSIDFVNIGHAGNASDTTGYGAVGYNYRMGRTEVSIDQFFKARNMDGRIGSGDENYWNSGIRTVGELAPVTASWFDAAMFCNWLTTGDAYTGVYQFNGSGTLVAIDRTYRNGSGLAYVLPSEDEWYKAAYFKPDGSGYSLYSSGLDTVPTWGGSDGWNYFNGQPSGTVNDYPSYTWIVGEGAEEQNGTLNMMGNEREWTGSAADGLLNNLTENRAIRGGDFGVGEGELRSSARFTAPPGIEIGFRVAAIPEPSSVLLLSIGSGALLFYRRARRREMHRHVSRKDLW